MHANGAPFPDSLVAGFHVGYLWGAILLLLGALIAFVLVRIKKHEYHANARGRGSGTGNLGPFRRRHFNMRPRGQSSSVLIMIRFLIRIAIFFGSALVALWVTDLIIADDFNAHVSQKVSSSRP